MDERISEQKQNIAALYNRVASTYDRMGPPIFSHFGRRIVELAGISPGAQVLDIATGRGANIFPAAEKVGPTGHIIGIDLAEAMVRETTEALQQKGIQNATILQMDAENLTFENTSFDYVLCSFAYFFFPNLEHALSEFFRVLRHQGRLIVTLRGDEDEQWRWYEELLLAYHKLYQCPLSSPGGTGHWEPAKFQELLTRIGFINIQSVFEEVEAVYTNEQEWWLSKWTHGARYALERMSPAILDKFHAEVRSRMASLKQLDGFHERWRIQCILATKL